MAREMVTPPPDAARHLKVVRPKAGEEIELFDGHGRTRRYRWEGGSLRAAGELATWQQRSARWPQRGLRFLATRFAAKEAFSKAIGLGMHEPMMWRRCEVVTLPGGAPGVRLHGALAAWFEQRWLRALLSLSDEGDYAVAMCVVECRCACNSAKSVV